MDDVIVLTFSATDQAREALRGLRRLHDAGDIRLEAVAVVERTQDGRSVILDQAEDVRITATATGGVIGGIIGLLGGPFGLFLGGATGAVVGSLFDIAEVEGSDDVLRSFAQAVPPGHTATIAVVEEPTYAAVDALASGLGVSVHRRPRGEVELEIAEAEEAALKREQEESS